MKEAVIVGGSRTAIGNFGGSLKTVPVVELGSIVMKDVLTKLGLRPAVSDEMKNSAPEALRDRGLTELEKKSYDWDKSLKPVAIDEVIMGNVLQAGQGQNTARQAMIKAGIPKETPAHTTDGCQPIGPGPHQAPSANASARSWVRTRPRQTAPADTGSRSSPIRATRQ